MLGMERLYKLSNRIRLLLRQQTVERPPLLLVYSHWADPFGTLCAPPLRQSPLCSAGSLISRDQTPKLAGHGNEGEISSPVAEGIESWRSQTHRIKSYCDSGDVSAGKRYRFSQAIWSKPKPDKSHCEAQGVDAHISEIAARRLSQEVLQLG